MSKRPTAHDLLLQTVVAHNDFVATYGIDCKNVRAQKHKEAILRRFDTWQRKLSAQLMIQPPTDKEVEALARIISPDAWNAGEFEQTAWVNIKSCQLSLIIAKQILDAGYRKL